MIKNRFYSYIRKAYMNIENPYYVVPNKTEVKMEIKSEEENEKSLNKTDQKRHFESQSCESIN